MSFLMPVEDVFAVPGRGTVVTGLIQRGVVGAGDKIEIVGLRETATATCFGVEQFRKRLDEGRAGQNVGIRLGGIKNVAGRLILPGELEMVVPGSPSLLEVELELPVAAEARDRFWIGDWESLGFGVVSKIIN